LIFTLALISCAGTNYIHSLSEQNSEEPSTGSVEMKVVQNDFEQMKRASRVKEVLH